MVNIKRKGKYYYVEGDDCYILYYFFKYRFKENKCYFNKKYLNNVVYTLVKHNVSFSYNKQLSFIDKDSMYEVFISLGKEKFTLNSYLLESENRLFAILESRKFNKIYNKLIKLG